MGWAIAYLGEVDEGIAEMREGIKMYKLVGVLPLGSHILSLLVEGLYLKNEYKEALEILEEAFDYCKRTDELFYLSRVNRLKGEGLQKLEAEAAEIEQCFRQAIDVAREQDAPMLELQAALSLTKHWKTQGKKEEIHLLLTELLERITFMIDEDGIAEYIEAKEILAACHF